MFVMDKLKYLIKLFKNNKIKKRNAIELHKPIVIFNAKCFSSLY